LTLPISDSLSAATSCSESRSLSTANAEPEDPEPEDPEPDGLDESPFALEAAVLERLEEAPVALALEPEDPEPLAELVLEALLVPCALTLSPTSPASETIVPVLGA
jgi:hypothetical protein